MLRYVFIAAGVVTTAVTGYFVKRWFSTTPAETPPAVIEMPQIYLAQSAPEARPAHRAEPGSRQRREQC